MLVKDKIKKSPKDIEGSDIIGVYSSRIGECMQAWREFYGYGQFEAAFRARMSQSQWSRLENGKVIARLDHLERTISSFKITWEEFFNGPPSAFLEEGDKTISNREDGEPLMDYPSET